MSPHHIIALLVPSWGHAVSYIYLATRILQKDPNLVITIVQHNSVVPKFELELRTCQYDIERLRIIGAGDKDTGTNLKFMEPLDQLAESWREIIPGMTQENEGWPKPHAVHMDMLVGGYVIELTKQIMGPDCKILMWWSMAVVSMPARLIQCDFAAIAQEIYSDEARRQGRSMDDILQQAAGSPAVAPHYVSAQKLAKFVDGFIVATSVCLEPVGVPYCREYYQNSGQDLFTIGMQAHELCWTDPAPAPPTNAVVRSFLEKSANQYGAKSVIYISFGSIFFPTATPELVEALVDTLLTLEKPLPFIFALGGVLASLPKDLIQRVHSSGKGLVCDFWIEHSMSDCLSQGIPVIVWPICGDQPFNAVLISSGLNPVAMELMQVPAGPQIGPSLRGGQLITGTVEDVSAEFKATFNAARG
ncbi:hypothetical protein DFH09DRAFT_1092158 [Mycena vulgaris]|nr:hypothetical protein DFH09DRAFT_1092158 [Mycena vulgaris]